METNKIWEKYSVDVLIPTYRSDEKLDRLLEMLYRQTKKPNRVIILHTVEKEGQEQAIPEIPDSNITIIPIDKSSFDHGGTRRYGATLSDADILLYMTQDAIPADEYLIENLLKPYEDTQVSATYARQLANDSSDIIEDFTRNFNYPDKSFMKSKADLKTLGIKTFFCSNVCASYRRDVYEEMGGFVKKTIFNEDMIMAASMIEAGYKIAYVAEAKVLHSHRYSYLQQFSRNFDLGVSHNQYPDVFGRVKSESEGIKLVKQTMQYLIENKEYLLIPDLIMTSGFKYLGYLFGSHYDLFPKDFVKHCSMNKSYWN
ncbi:MAG: glycosyltransferase family 2 protein [Clostridiales bacterium]|nr:glycosyltransferase family 2 protein [Clostridiales bacterium]